MSRDKGDEEEKKEQRHANANKLVGNGWQKRRWDGEHSLHVIHTMSSQIALYKIIMSAPYPPYAVKR